MSVSEGKRVRGPEEGIHVLDSESAGMVRQAWAEGKGVKRCRRRVSESCVANVGPNHPGQEGLVSINRPMDFGTNSA